MAVTRADITITQGVWTNLYAASGIAVGTEVEVFNKGTYAIKVAVSATQPVSENGIFLFTFTDGDDPLQIPPGEPGLWALCSSGDGRLLVQEQSLQRHTFGASLSSHVHPKGMDFYTAAGLNMIPGVRRVAALGNNPDIDQGTIPEDVWTGGGLYPFMTAATSLEIVSTSAADAAAGTGARTVTINGLDINYVEVVQTVTLNGTTPVAIPTQLFRINSALIMSSGTGGTNAGDINIRNSGAGTVRAIIPAGYGITRQSVFTVPAGHTMSVHSNVFSLNRAGGIDKNVTLATFVRSPNGFHRLPLELSVSQIMPYRHDGIPGVIVAEKNDFAIRCTFSSASDVDVTAAWLGLLIANTTLALV